MKNFIDTIGNRTRDLPTCNTLPQPTAPPRAPSALRTGRLYPTGNIPGTHFCWRLSRPQGHSAARRIMSMKNFNDTIGNRTRDLPTCNTVLQPTAPPRASSKQSPQDNNKTTKNNLKKILR